MDKAKKEEYGREEYCAYSTSYKDVSTLADYKERGKDAWRSGLVTGNGENGMIESCGPAEDVFIFQNIRFNYPTNAIRVTPDLSGAREEVVRSLVQYGDGQLTGEGAEWANHLMLKAASEWVRAKGLAEEWKLQNSYAFHPGHQLRLRMRDSINGREKAYVRYTNYSTAEIGTKWTDEAGREWERKSFSSREDNVNITLLHSLNGAKISMTVSVDDIAGMSNEGGVDSRLADVRYKKFAAENGEYIGFVGHYPYYRNSGLNNAGFAGVTRVIVTGESARREYIFRTREADGIVNPIGGADERIINLGYDKAPSIKISDADAVFLITKTGRDLQMGTMGKFESDNGTDYPVVHMLVEDTAFVAAKYSRKGDYSDFDYEAAFAPSARKHREVFERLTCSLCVDARDKEMRFYTNERLILEQQQSGKRLLPAMLERLYHNGRFAAICSCGTWAPRLGGMWTGAWGCEWSGDFTTDANINLQMAGANIGNLPEQTIGYIQLMLKNIVDWQLNAKQIYGIDDALMAPPRTDGDTAVLTHFSKNFPGEIWNAGAGWLILPIYEFYQCFGNHPIPVTPELRKELSYQGNRYDGYTEIKDKHGREGIWYEYGIVDGGGHPVVYNMRNTLGLSDRRVDKILASGYFDLKEDILYPLLTKTANFWLGFADSRFYTRDGVAYYEETHTVLEDREKYLFAPGYSPENRPANTESYFTMNAVMDVAVARSVMEMAVTLETDEARLARYKHFLKSLPENLYGEEGELKEWSLLGYEENYGHRHASQLYGVWPGYEAGADGKLRSGSRKLIQMKNACSGVDDKSGHGWLHRGLVMARLKDGAGVGETLLALVAKDMIYPSMMMAHNNDMTAAYCTDPVITIPALLLETLVYSDQDVIELLPAVLSELSEGGCLGGTEGMPVRSRARISYLSWNREQVAVGIKGASGKRLLLAGVYKSLMVNGNDVTSQMKTDREGRRYYKIEEDVIVAIFTGV